MSNIGNERDLEIDQLLRFIRSNKGINSTLDVGAHSAAALYAKDVKKLVKKADGIDIAEDTKTAKVYDNYFVGNVADQKLLKYDLVFSISSIEHSGISTYRVADWRAERQRVFKKMYDLSKKYLYVTCPFGRENLIEGQYATVTEDDLNAFNSIAKGNIIADFYFTPGQFQGWRQMDRDDAVKIPFDEGIGIPRCIAILMVGKK